MNYWLVKSEPSVYSWEQFVKDGGTFWDGIRNFQARNNLKAMTKGDHVFFYHSNEGMEIVGIAKVAKEAYPDPADDKWSVVDLKPVKKLKKPVTLAEIKSTPALGKMVLVSHSRLSVSPVKEEEYDLIISMSERG